MPIDLAEKLLKNNALENQNAGMTLPNPNGGSIALVTDINALKNGSKIISLVAWPPVDSNGQMINIDGDVGHTSLILGKYNQVETSYGKYPAHEMQVAFIFSAVSNEPIQGEISKKPADYLERRMRSQDAHGITFLLNDEDYQKIEKIIERDVKKDRNYDLNCDNCSSWAVETLKKINIDFDSLVGPSANTPWDISDFIDEMFTGSNILTNIANKYQNIQCANPLDITKSLSNFWDSIEVEQTELDSKNEELSEPQQNFLQKLGHYLGISLSELELAINTDGAINVATEGSLTRNISPHFSVLDFGIDTNFFHHNDPIRLNQALLSLLRANFDLSGIQAGGSALSLIIKESDEGIEVISEWLGVNVQISFYLNKDRKIRLLVKGGVALQSSTKHTGLQVPFNFETAVQFAQLIISYAYESDQTHKLRFEFNLTDDDSIFIEGGANTQNGKPRFVFRFGYHKKY